MNVVLLTIMCTLALPHGSNAMMHNPSRSSTPVDYNNRPCQRNYNNNAFNKFLQKHILQKPFNKNSEWAWEKYLKKKSLCHRAVQSFIMKSNENDVVQICNGSGWRVRDNLCISASTFEVYNIEVDTWNCKVKRIERGTKYVVVACDKVGNQCLPVHFEKYTNQWPTTERCHA